MFVFLDNDVDTPICYFLAVGDAVRYTAYLFENNIITRDDIFIYDNSHIRVRLDNPYEIQFTRHERYVLHVVEEGISTSYLYGSLIPRCHQYRTDTSDDTYMQLGIDQHAIDNTMINHDEYIDDSDTSSVPEYDGTSWVYDDRKLGYYDSDDTDYSELDGSTYDDSDNTLEKENEEYLEEEDYYESSDSDY